MTEGKKFLLRFLILLGIFEAVNLVWQSLELVRYGRITPSAEDSIMGMALALSLYYNLRIQPNDPQSL